MTKTTEEPTRARKSIDELTDTIERSGEKVVKQLNSTFLTCISASTEIFVGAVQFASDFAEAGAERFSPGKASRKEKDESSTPLARIVKSQKETLAEAVRTHQNALKQSMDITEGSVDRIIEKTKAASTTAAE